MFTASGRRRCCLCFAIYQILRLYRESSWQLSPLRAICYREVHLARSRIECEDSPSLMFAWMMAGV